MGQETNLDKLSTEDLLKLKADHLKRMKSNLESLRVQDEYSRLKANIAENTLREHMSKVKLASIKVGPEPEKKPQKKKKE